MGQFGARLRVHWPVRVALLALILLMTVASQAEEASTQQPESKPDYSAMASLLEDEASRNRLIAELRALAENKTQEGEGDSLADKIDLSLAAPVSLAGETLDLVESISGEVTTAVDAVTAIDFSERSGTLRDFFSALIRLGLVALVSILVYTLAHKLANPISGRAASWVEKGQRTTRVWRELAGFVVPLLTALLSIALAWAAAWTVALFFLSPDDGIADEIAVFLNAFLIVEGTRVLLEAFLSPEYKNLRLVPVEDSSARYWNRWAGWIIGFVGYGLLVAYPLLSDNFSPALGQVLALGIILVTYVTLAVLVLRNRQRGRMRLQRTSRSAGMAMTRGLLGVLARVWHILALLYLTALMLVAINDPENGLPLMAKATAQTVLAIGLGGLLSSILTRLIGTRLRLPQSIAHWSPALETQLNRYLPTWMKVIRIVITFVVIAVVMDAWTGFDLAAWAESETGAWLIESATTVALIVTGGVLVWVFAASWIEHRLTEDGPSTAASARQKTLLGLFRNAIAIAVMIVTLMIVLSELGINIAPLLASAGVLGLAIGFGAQKLVQDIITGIFIQLENAINTGDVVTVAGYSGEAERITIRSLGLRDLSGTYHIIPFSSVDTVSNFMRGFSYHLGEYGIAYRENTDEALDHMRAAFDELKENPDQSPYILDDLEVHGVTQLGDSAVMLRVRIKTMPGKQWGVGREYNRLIKRHFDAAGIEIPFPHTTLYFGQDKDGSAPPAPITVLDRGKRNAQSDSQEPNLLGNDEDAEESDGSDRKGERDL
ncbi:mechanosensitive ion channel domain-containing protein [Hydrocarboniclastica marina]|nr:mechanosensitive ion channel domain-containing protein [Hydrocarboniclastica marina]